MNTVQVKAFLIKATIVRELPIAPSRTVQFDCDILEYCVAQQLPSDKLMRAIVKMRNPGELYTIRSVTCIHLKDMPFSIEGFADHSELQDALEVEFGGHVYCRTFKHEW